MATVSKLLRQGFRALPSDFTAAKLRLHSSYRLSLIKLNWRLRTLWRDEDF